MEKNLAWWLVKIDRAAAWTLLAAILMFFISGYGMTKGLIDPNLFYLLHNNILPAIGLPAFIVHTFLAVRLALLRWRKWNKTSAGLMAFVYLVFFVAMAYTGYFYEPAASAPASTAKQSVKSNETAANTTEATKKIFTSSDLAKYNGKNGNSAYIAIDGDVYDVSTLFVNGAHHSCTAGREVSAGFWAIKKHIKSMLADYPIVGTYEH